MNKKQYISPCVRIYNFADEDVITASDTIITTIDPNKPIELPFVPAP